MDDGDLRRYARLLANEPYPCDGCVHQLLCKRHLMACGAFATYVNYPTGWPGGSRKPLRSIYAKLFRVPPLQALSCLSHGGGVPMTAPG